MITTRTLQYQDHIVESIDNMNGWLIKHTPALCDVEGFIVDRETYNIMFDMPLAKFDGYPMVFQGYPIYCVDDYNVYNSTSFDIVDEPLVLANDVLITFLAGQTRLTGIEPFMLFDQFVNTLCKGNTSLDNVTW